MDGSCSRTGLAGLDRAAWAAVSVSREGALLTALTGLVAGPAMQTSGAAENMAFGALVPRLGGTAAIYSDYQSLCDALQLDRGRMLAHTRTYAGVLKGATGHHSYGLVDRVVKVQAHVDATTLDPASEEWFLAKGNEWADAHAKIKVAAHQSYSDQLLVTMLWESTLAAKVCRFAGEALALWPSRRDALGKRPRPPPASEPVLPLAPPAPPHYPSSVGLLPGAVAMRCLPGMGQHA